MLRKLLRLLWTLRKKVDEKISKGEKLSPLEGIPMTLKDNISTDVPLCIHWVLRPSGWYRYDQLRTLCNFDLSDLLRFSFFTSSDHMIAVDFSLARMSVSQGVLALET